MTENGPRLLLATVRQMWLDRILDLPSNPLTAQWKARALRRRGFRIGDNPKFGRGFVVKGEVSIGAGLRANRNVMIAASPGAAISVGDDCLIGPNVVIRNANHGYRDLSVPMFRQPRESMPIVIEDDVWIAANSVILAGAVIRTGAIVAAGAVVTKGEVPPYAIVGGAPAHVIGHRGEASAPHLRPADEVGGRESSARGLQA